MRIVNNLNSKFIFSNETSFDNNSSNDNNNENKDRKTQNWKFNKINFFNPEYENVNNVLIINVDKHIFYRDMYAFIDRLKNVISFCDKNKLCIIIFQCL